MLLWPLLMCRIMSIGSPFLNNVAHGSVLFSRQMLWTGPLEVCVYDQFFVLGMIRFSRCHRLSRCLICNHNACGWLLCA